GSLHRVWCSCANDSEAVFRRLPAEATYLPAEQHAGAGRDFPLHRCSGAGGGRSPQGQGRTVRFLTRGRKTRGIEEGPANLVVVARADTRGGHRETPPGDGQADQVVLEESCSEDRAVSAGGPEEEGKVTGSLVPRAHIPFTLTLPQGTGVFMSVWI